MIIPGTKFPDFQTTACVSLDPGKEFESIGSKSYPGKWLVLYTYPKDFTFVCPTEIVELDNKRRDFADRDAVIIGGSTDNEYSHLAWRKDHPGLRKISHPLMHVPPTLATELGILHPIDGVALRATIIVDPEGIVRYAAANDLSVGRNVNEILRILDALQTDELCPCNWSPGQETLTHELQRAG